jgi:hypothetical protein
VKMQFGLGKGENEIRAVGRQLLLRQSSNVILSEAKDLLLSRLKTKADFSLPSAAQSDTQFRKQPQCGFKRAYPGTGLDEAGPDDGFCRRQGGDIPVANPL